MAELVETRGKLLSYAPAFLLRALDRPAESGAVPRAERFPAAMLFADIVGFTPLAERLARHGSFGAEELSALLNVYFGQLIDVVAAHGGETYRFAGDALLALWPVLGAADDLALVTRRAAQCGLAIQATLHDYPVAGDERLSLRVGVGAGNLLAAYLGGVAGHVEYLLAGDPLHQIGAAARQARPGGVVLSGAAFALAPADFVARPAPDGVLHLQGLRAPPPPLSPETPVWPPHLRDAVRPYVLAPVLARLEAGQTDWLAELRCVTVLFVNVVDIDAAGPDALERLQAIVHAAQATLGAYEGTLCQVIVADQGLVLVGAFGLAPSSHEDDAARGVFAAGALRAELLRAGVRSSIGMSTGLAFCGPIGNDLRREYSLTGDVINLAARLMESGPDDVLCDAATREAARAQLGFEPLPPLRVKGKAEPLAIFRPTGRTQPSAGPIRPDSMTLIGRAAERQLLAEQLRTLARSGSAGTIVVEGEPGIGKSRLLRDLLAQAERLGLSSLSGAGDAIERSTPYYAWRPVFSYLFGLHAAADEVAARRSQVLAQLVDEVPTESGRPAPTSLQLAPLLNAVLPLDFEDNELTAAMSGEARADNTRELLVRLLKRAVASEPLLLVLEDAHWLDSASWVLVRLIRQRVQKLLLVIATRPPAEVAPTEYRELLAAAGTRFVRLGPLSDDETIELVGRRLGVAGLPDPVEALIREKAQGHPFYAEELAYAVRDAGVITIADGACRLAPAADDLRSLALPTTLRGVITSRIDRLTPSQQLTLKVASVIGRVFPRDAVREIHPTEDEAGRVTEDLEVLRQLDFVQLDRPAPEPTYLFRHVLTQEVAYDLMLFAQRRQLHRAVAEWYEYTSADDLGSISPLLAYHWTRALHAARDEPDLAAKAVDYLEKAGEQAIGSYANAEAIRHFDEALRLAAELGGGGGGDAPAAPDRRPTDPRHPGRAPSRWRQACWEHHLGEAYFQLGRAPESVEHLRRALALMEFPAASTTGGLVVSIVRESARQLLHRASPRRFIRPVPNEARPRLVETAEVYARLALVTYIGMQELGSISALLRGLNIAELAGPSGVLMRTNYQMGNFTGLLFASPALHERYFRRALSLAGDVADRASEAEMWFGHGLFLIHQACWTAADEATARGQDLYERMGDRRWVELSLYQRANIAMLRGDFARSLALCTEAGRSALDRGDIQAQAWLLIEEAHTRLMLGQHAEALRLLDDAERRLTTSGISLSDPAAQLWGDATRALAHAQRGEPEPALRAAQAAAGLIKPYLNFVYYSMRGFGNLAAACLELWEALPPEAVAERNTLRRLARRSTDAARTFTRSSPCGQPQALLWRGRYDRLSGRPERAGRAWQAALASAERLEMPYEAGLAHWQIGRHLPGQDGRRHLERAAQIFAELGAQHHLARARAALGPGGEVAALSERGDPVGPIP